MTQRCEKPGRCPQCWLHEAGEKRALVDALLSGGQLPFAHEVLGVADTAAIMLHGSIRRVGPPEQIAEELTEAYLAGSTGS